MIASVARPTASGARIRVQALCAQPVRFVFAARWFRNREPLSTGSHYRSIIRKYGATGVNRVFVGVVGGGAAGWLRLARDDCERDIWITTLLKYARAFSTR